MNTYKIIINPVDTFYFGSERKFNPADGSGANYLVESLKYPQQTTILGMLRFALLTGKIKIKKSLSNTELIGEQSFDPQFTQYGIIKKISPVYLTKEGDIFIEAGLNYQKYEDKETKEINPIHLELTSIKGLSSASVKSDSEVYFYSNHDHKQYFSHYLTKKGEDNPLENLISYDDVFIACQQPGNRKDRSGKTSLEGYYKQTKYRLKNNYSFCVFMQSEENIESVKFFAVLGGDQSLFEITFQKDDNDSFPTFLEGEEQEGIVKLVSPAFINQLTNSHFSVLETIDFRYFKAKLGETNNYSDMSPIIYKRGKKNMSFKTPMMSQQIRLISRGSVFYCKNVKEFVKNLNHSGYRTIGYNYCEIIY